MNESNLQIIPWHDKSNNQQCEISSAKNLDCEYGRILTKLSCLPAKAQEVLNIVNLAIISTIFMHYLVAVRI